MYYNGRDEDLTCELCLKRAIRGYLFSKPFLTVPLQRHEVQKGDVTQYGT